MPRFTVEQYAATIAKPGYRVSNSASLGDKKLRPHPIVQKLQDDPLATKADHDQTGEPKVDGTSGAEFRVTVTFRISDARDRDNDGAFSTLADCLVASIGRLTEMDARTLRKHAAGFKRPRRGNNRNRKNPVT